MTGADRTEHGLGVAWENGSNHLVFDERGVGTFTGRCEDTEVNLRVENFHPMSQMWPIGQEGVHRHVEQTMAFGHYERSGRATGTLKARGQTYEIDALCHRDHSWGPREWKGFTDHRWIVGGLGEELSFSGLIAMPSGGDDKTGGVLQGGFVARGQEIDFMNTPTASSTSSPTTSPTAAATRRSTHRAATSSASSSSRSTPSSSPLARAATWRRRSCAA